MSFVSVIVPVYKVEEYLPRCVDSILNQTFSDFDLVLVDDGSPDGSGIICDEYAQKDSRIIVLHQKNKGAAAARNNGIEYSLDNCSSSFLSFIDSDDWVAPNYLEVLVKAVKETKCRVSICGYEKTDKTADLPHELEEAKIIKAENYIFENDIRAIVPWGKLYDKNLWLNIRYPEGRICEDEFVTYKILLESDDLYLSDEVLYYYFQNSQSVMNNQWSLKRLDGVDALCERYGYLEENYPKLTDHCLIQIWRVCRYQGQNALLYLNDEEQQQAFDYLNKVMKDYVLPWKLLFDQSPKEIFWNIMQKINFQMFCRIRNSLSIGL